jgi:hypothetical protein
MQTISVYPALPGRRARNAFVEPSGDIMTRRRHGRAAIWRALFPYSTRQSNNNFDVHTAEFQAGIRAGNGRRSENRGSTENRRISGC